VCVTATLPPPSALARGSGGVWRARGDDVDGSAHRWARYGVRGRFSRMSPTVFGACPAAVGTSALPPLATTPGGVCALWTPAARLPLAAAAAQPGDAGFSASFDWLRGWLLTAHRRRLPGGLPPAPVHQFSSSARRARLLPLPLLLRHPASARRRCLYHLHYSDRFFAAPRGWARCWRRRRLLALRPRPGLGSNARLAGAVGALPVDRQRGQTVYGLSAGSLLLEAGFPGHLSWCRSRSPPVITLGCSACWSSALEFGRVLSRSQRPLLAQPQLPRLPPRDPPMPNPLIL